MKRYFILTSFILLTLLSATVLGKDNSAAVPANGSSLPYTVLITLPNGTEVRNGGYGSSAMAHPTQENLFYAITDRGPNADYTGDAGKGKKFPVPYYSPRIGLFKINDDGRISLEKEIILKNPAGKAITGLPNPKGRGATGEVPYDNSGKVLSYDDYGLDSEGIVALKNGEFWICDEYGPHIVHYSREGVELERISPVGVDTGKRKLPAVLKRRRANRGMEGLTITPDEKVLVSIMQSTLFNPKKAETKNTKVTRIITFDLKSAKTRQYLYFQEKAWNANSEITALSNTTFLVVERDGKFSGAEAAQKHVYKIDISGATDVSGKFDDQNGMLINGKTIEQCSMDEIKAAGIKPVQKELVVDLVKYLPNHYPHDKLEGIVYINNRTIAVLNDDDFAVSVEKGEVIQKILPGTSDIDGNRLYIIRLGSDI